MVKTILLGASLLAAHTFATAASEQPFACPTELAGTEQQAKAIPEGWTAAVQDSGPRHLLNGFMINLGPISKADGSIYDDVKESTDVNGNVTSRLIWNVKVLEDAFAVCAYSRTSLVLTRPLKGYSECVATSRRGRDTQFRMESAVCR